MTERKTIALRPEMHKALDDYKHDQRLPSFDAAVEELLDKEASTE